MLRWQSLFVTRLGYARQMPHVVATPLHLQSPAPVHPGQWLTPTHCCTSLITGALPPLTPSAVAQRNKLAATRVATKTGVVCTLRRPPPADRLRQPSFIVRPV